MRHCQGFSKTEMGRPPKKASEKFVPVSARIPPPLAEQITKLRTETGQTLSAMIEDGLRRVLKAAAARRRKRQD